MSWSVWSILVVAPVLSLAGCGTDEVWSCQNSTTTGGFSGTQPTDCQNQWICDGDIGVELLLQVTCTNGGGSFHCVCTGNGQEKGSFTAGAEVCDTATVAARANDQCGWRVPEE